MAGLVQVKDAEGISTKLFPLWFLGLAQMGHCGVLELLSFLHFITSEGMKNAVSCCDTSLSTEKDMQLPASHSLE